MSFLFLPGKRVFQDADAVPDRACDTLFPGARRAVRARKIASPTASASSREGSAAIAASTCIRATQSNFTGEEELSVSGLVHLNGRV